MYASVDMPNHQKYRVFEDGVYEQLDLVVAVDEEAGYIIYYKRYEDNNNKTGKIVTVRLRDGTWHPLPLIRFGKFRLEEKRNADV